MKTRRSENGQALVLIILAITGLFGFAGLALDIGQIYLARRNAQTAADAASMAAVYDVLNGSKDPATAIQKGIDIANTNGFDNTDKSAYETKATNNLVEVNNPPNGGGPYCGPCNSVTESEYYQVRITVRLRPIFAQLVYKGAEEVTVEAISRAKKPDTVSTGDALQSLSGDDTAMDLNGTLNIEIFGGNIRSNGGLVEDGNSSHVNVGEDGHIYFATIYPPKHPEIFSIYPEQDPAAYVYDNLKAPCPTAADLASWTNSGSFYTKNINAVNYYYYPGDLTVQNLPSGIHCINGNIGHGNFTGQQVLVVLLNGEVSQTGNDSVDFRAATDLIDFKGNQWGGMVFYAPRGNTNTLVFGGNSGQYFYGTVYAPSADCDFGGTPNGTAEHTAFICSTIKFHGTPDISIYYDPAELFHFRPELDVVQ